MNRRHTYLLLGGALLCILLGAYSTTNQAATWWGISAGALIIASYIKA